MAALTPEQWRECRAAWEASDEQGVAWLTVKGGGPFDVSEEVIRRRRSREGWLKRGVSDSVVRKAQLEADKAVIPQEKLIGVPDPDPRADPPDLRRTHPKKDEEPDPAAVERELAQVELSEQVSVAVRAELLKRHRGEWAAVRKLAYQAIQGSNFETAKLAKISSETFRIIQEGERKAYGLDKTDGGGQTIVIDRS